MYKRYALVAVLFSLAPNPPLYGIDFWWSKPKELPQEPTHLIIEPIEIVPSVTVEAPLVAQSPPYQLLCQDLKEIWKNQGDPLPIADWLNATQIGSFYQTTFPMLLSKEKSQRRRILPHWSFT